MIDSTALVVGGSVQRRAAIITASIVGIGLLLVAAVRPGWLLIPLAGLLVLALALLPWRGSPAWDRPRRLGRRTIHLHACRRVCIAPSTAGPHIVGEEDADGTARHLGTWIRGRSDGCRIHLTLHDGTEVVATTEDRRAAEGLGRAMMEGDRRMSARHVG